MIKYKAFEKYLKISLDDSLLKNNEQKVPIRFIVNKDSSITCLEFLKQEEITQNVRELITDIINKVKFLPALANPQKPIHMVSNTFVVLQKRSLKGKADVNYQKVGLDKQIRNARLIQSGKKRREKLY